jgi:hypothetical protein
MTFGRLQFLALIAAALALPETAGASFSCQKQFISCKKVTKTVIKTGPECENFASDPPRCQGEVRGLIENDCNPGANAGEDGYISYNLSTYDASTNIDGLHYIYGENVSGIPGRIPFPPCVEDTCALYQMSDVPQYRK